MISIAMCTYNGEHYIEEQLRSILLQTRKPDEIIICDDCSDDDTVNKIEKMLSSYTGEAKVIRNKKNLGYKRNFQKAIGLCKGDIIFLSDQDDIWNLNKIEIMMDQFEKHPNASMVFHDAELVDENLNPIASSFWKILHFNPQEFLMGNYERLLKGNVIQGSACAFRKDIFIKAFPFPIEAVHDEWLGLVASLYGAIIPVPAKLMKYRQGHNQIGGEEKTLREGIRLWYNNILALRTAHLNQLKNRKTVLLSLIQRYPQIISTVQKKKWNKYINFNNERIDFIVGRKNKINLLNYFTYSNSSKQSFRQLIKDCYIKISLLGN